MALSLVASTLWVQECNTQEMRTRVVNLEKAAKTAQKLTNGIIHWVNVQMAYDNDCSPAQRPVCEDRE